MSRESVVLAATLALGGAGCFASWGAVQIANGAHILEEGAREVTVPLPGVQERLAVSLPLAIELDYPASPASASATTKTTTATTTTATAGSPAAQPTPREFELQCETRQHARNNVHRSAFRYGKKWKYATATMFLIEAAVATASYFGDRENPQNQLTAGVLALDAIGTAALFFAPRKEIYRTEIRNVSDRVRTDCPDGLTLDIGGEVYPIDAAGRIGELGVAALDAWMQAPGGPIRIAYAGQTADVVIGPAEQCAWNRSHHPDPASPASPASPADPANPAAAPPSGPGAQSPSCPRYGPVPPRQVSASIDVPMGTLTRFDAVPDAP